MKKIIAANWKMNKNSQEAAQTVQELSAILNNTLPEKREVIIFPSFISLEASIHAAPEKTVLQFGAQDVYPAKDGAYTGEISPSMILDAGASWVLTGHSERRHIIKENNAFVGQKTSFALASGLNVVACVGETLEEREAGRLYDVLSEQLNQTLAKLPTPLSPERLVVAYEPVWAIGTGKTAGSEDIIEAHAIIRELLKNIIGTSVFQTRILYGGSVKPENAAEILKLENVDGLLVGGASLKADSFAKIICA